MEEAVHCGELPEDYLLQLGGGQAELRPQPHPRPQQGRRPRITPIFFLYGKKNWSPRVYLILLSC